MRFIPSSLRNNSVLDVFKKHCERRPDHIAKASKSSECDREINHPLPFFCFLDGKTYAFIGSNANKILTPP